MRLELIHPMIIHFPIVLAMGLFALDACASMRDASLARGTAMGVASLTLAVSAGLFAILAYVFGDQAYDIALATGKAPDALLEMHQELGTATAVALVVWATVRAYAWMRGAPLDGGRRLALTAIEGGLVLAVLATAWYGGQLVYDHGVAVIAAS